MFGGFTLQLDKGAFPPVVISSFSSEISFKASRVRAAIPFSSFPFVRRTFLLHHQYKIGSQICGNRFFNVAFCKKIVVKNRILTLIVENPTIIWILPFSLQNSSNCNCIYFYPCLFRHCEHPVLSQLRKAIRLTASMCIHSPGK